MKADKLYGTGHHGHNVHFLATSYSFRGDYDKRREQVKAATPGVLPSFAADLPRNRLGLAKWLLQPDHPLTTHMTH